MQAKLLIAASEHDADMLYISGMFVPDAFIAIGLFDGDAWQWHGIFSPLEIDRARSESTLHHVHDTSNWQQAADKSGLGRGLLAITLAFLHAHNIAKVTVPGAFPLMYADKLRNSGIEVEAANGSLFPQREIKDSHEIKQLAKAEKLTRRSMAEAENFLAACSIGNDNILRHPESGKKVRSKHVRRAIETWLIAHGAIPAHTIVACGEEAADPHCTGHGYIVAGKPIIIDIFPRLQASGYWGDMTRTFVKGKASEEVQRLYNTVRDGQQIGLEMLCIGREVKNIHQAIQQYFDQQGFTTGIKNGRQSGFFHGTGHGVGLEIHEQPRISICEGKLQKGQVVTVEPGLYYPGLGGVRLEDLTVITNKGHRNLTNHPCTLLIP